MSPVDDTFLSGSLDKTIRLWDLRSPNCQVFALHYCPNCLSWFILWLCVSMSTDLLEPCIIQNSIDYRIFDSI